MFCDSHLKEEQNDSNKEVIDLDDSPLKEEQNDSNKEVIDLTGENNDVKNEMQTCVKKESC